jgi:beta-lactamase regulating signal transducer with metallopeptidase domain
MRRWLTVLVFVLALAVPAFAQDSGAQQQQGQPAQSSQSSGSSSKQTSTTTTTQKSTTPTEVQRTTGIDPLYLAIGGIALITIIAIALLASRSRRGRDTAVVRETTVIKD